MKPSFFQIIAAMFLVAGTCIGGGMLALPLVSGVGGFVPSLVILALCAFFMGMTGLLFVEASLWMEDGVHVITMTSRVLGPIGKWISWILYLFTCYASLVAYGAGGGTQISAALQYYMGIEAFLPLVILGLLACLILFLLLGGEVVERVNALLFIGVIASFILLVAMAAGEVKPGFLLYSDWSQASLSVPLILTAFSFQTMAPSLTPLLRRNPNALRWTIIGGMVIVFLFYAIWQAVVLGTVPLEGANGLREALATGDLPATEFLKQHVCSSIACVIAELFAFFAIVTSFLGIALGLYDFLSDGLKIPKRGFGKLILALLILLPTWCFAVSFERIFLIALDTTGGYGDTILNGLIPISMIYAGRYMQNRKGSLTIGGGRTLLFIAALFYLACLFYEIFSNLSYFYN